MAFNVDRDELLARIDLRVLLDELSPRPAANSGPAGRWACIDPDHNDQHPSVTVTTDSGGVQRWKCWSGGHGGTAIDAVMIHYRVSAAEAMRELAGRAGLDVDGPALRPRSTAPKPTPPPPPPTVLTAEARRYVHACERVLWGPAGSRVRDWLLDERGFSEAVLRVNRVGCDPGPDVLWRAKGLPWHGVGAVFPALDPTGEIAYLQTRYLEVPEGRDKYDNPPARMGSNPRTSWINPPTPRGGQVLVVTEGIPDALSAADAGFAAVGVLGSQYPDRRVADAIRDNLHGRRLVLAFDGDDAGRAAHVHLSGLLADIGVHSVDARVPTGTDLNMLSVTDPQWWEQFTVRHSTPATLTDRYGPPAVHVDEWTAWKHTALATGHLVPAAETAVTAASLLVESDRALATAVIAPAGTVRAASEASLLFSLRAVMVGDGVDLGPSATSATITDYMAHRPQHFASGHIAAARDTLDAVTWRHVHSGRRDSTGAVTAVGELAEHCRTVTGTAREPRTRARTAHRAALDSERPMRLVR